MEHEPIERERPNRKNVRKGDLVFLINLNNEVVSGEVDFVFASKVGVRYGESLDFVPYANLAFHGGYGGFVMGAEIERRMFPKAA